MKDPLRCNYTGERAARSVRRSLHPFKESLLATNLVLA